MRAAEEALDNVKLHLFMVSRDGKNSLDNYEYPDVPSISQKRTKRPYMGSIMHSCSQWTFGTFHLMVRDKLKALSSKLEKNNETIYAILLNLMEN